MTMMKDHETNLQTCHTEDRRHDRTRLERFLQAGPGITPGRVFAIECHQDMAHELPEDYDFEDVPKKIKPRASYRTNTTKNFNPEEEYQA